MIRRVFTSLLMLALSVAPGAVSAQTDAATVASLMNKSGLGQALGDLAPQVRTGLARDFANTGLKVSEEELSRLHKLADSAYSADRLRAVASASLEKEIKTADLSDLNAWYDSALGVKITQVEVAASAAGQDSEKFMRQGMVLFSKAPETRRDLLKQITTATRSPEMLTAITIDVTLATAIGVTQAMPDNPSISIRELRTQMQAQRPAILQSMTAICHALFASTYAAISDAELANYLIFLKSPVGQRFNDAILRALSAAIVDGSAAFGRGFPSTKDGANI
jgi:ABC-type Fe3+-siderophore transport system permease subunit